MKGTAPIPHEALLAELFSIASPGTFVVETGYLYNEDGSYQLNGGGRPKWNDRVAVTPVDDLSGLVVEDLDRYFTIQPRIEPKRGTEANTAEVICFGYDFDIEADPNSDADPSKFESIDEVLEFIETSIPVPPSAMVRSGGGLHVYWFLQEPVDPETGKSINQRFHTFIQGNANAQGRKIDSMFDTARVLRVPGTMNLKPELGDPQRVETIELHRDRRYGMDDFAFAPPVGDDSLGIGEAVAFEAEPMPVPLPPGVAIILGDEAKDDGSNSDRFTYLIKTAVEHGLTDGQIHTLVLHHAPSLKKYGGRSNLAELIVKVSAPHRAKVEEERATIETPEQQRHTDIGFSNILAEIHGDKIRYVPKWGRWIVWHRRKWNVDDRDVLITKLAKDVAKNLYNSLPTRSLKGDQEITKAARRASNAQTIRNFIVLARGAEGVRIEPNELDTDPWLFGVENGYIDLRTGTFHEPDPSKLITKIAPVQYDPDATAPTFMKALEQWHPDDPEVREYLQRIVGHAIAGESKGDHVFVIHYGGGRNGKGTLVRALEKLFGPYAVVPDKSLIMQMKREEHSTVKASLFRVRLAVASETSKRQRLNESDVKNLTGGDRINARYMKADEFWFEPTHSLWLLTNHRPMITDTSTGIWSRVKVIPWLQRFEGEGKDRDIDEELKKELPGILNWIIEGCVRWQDVGLDTAPDSVRAATTDYRESEDLLSRFQSDRGYEFVGLLEGSVVDEDLKASLEMWCRSNNLDAIGSREMNSWLESKGCITKRRFIDGRKLTVWQGIRQIGGAA